MQSRNRLIHALKLLVTIALIAVIVWQVDLREFWDAIRAMSWGYVLAAWMMLFVGVAVSAFKWQRLLMVHGVRFAFIRLFRWYLVGAFVGNFLPSTIGGDGYRIYKTLPNPRSKASAVLAVVVERLSGLLALVILAYAAAISIYLRDQQTFSYGIAAVGTVALISGLVILVAALYGKLGKRLLNVRYVPDAVKSLIDHAGEYKNQPGQIVLTMALSFLFHSVRFTGGWLILQGFGVEMRVDQFALVSMVTPLIAMIPISLNGWGLQEGSMFFLLQQFGVSSTVALAVALVIRVNMTSVALVGGLIYFFGAGEDKAALRSDDTAKRVRSEKQEVLQQ